MFRLLPRLELGRFRYLPNPGEFQEERYAESKSGFGVPAIGDCAGDGGQF
jgi:hypothetical protein